MRYFIGNWKMFGVQNPSILLTKSIHIILKTRTKTNIG